MAVLDAATSWAAISSFAMRSIFRPSIAFGGRPSSCLGVDVSQSKLSFEDYDGFVEKFKPKKTTDDCMTPPDVYEFVLSYVCGRWGVDRSKVVRPFWPGGDFEAFEYAPDAVVVDNPPFSKLAAIERFYLDRAIPFFLFAPSLTCLSGKSVAMRCNHVICDACIEYDNGAKVRTSFVTSYGYPTVYETSPELSEAINRVQDERRRATTKQLPKYEYPDHVLTAAMGQRYAKYGVRLSVSADECCLLGALDSQRDAGKAIFGGGLLLSERAAAERAAAERAAAHRWPLSERERAVVARLR